MPHRPRISRCTRLRRDRPTTSRACTFCLYMSRSFIVTAFKVIVTVATVLLRMVPHFPFRTALGVCVALLFSANTANSYLGYNWIWANMPRTTALASSAALYLFDEIRLFRCLVFELYDLLRAIFPEYLPFAHWRTATHLLPHSYSFQLFRWKPTTSSAVSIHITQLISKRCSASIHSTDCRKLMRFTGKWFPWITSTAKPG